ncbi:MAG: Rieske 2Fe-2S domain-containing protein [Geminicoccaceae bacterium]
MTDDAGSPWLPIAASSDLAPRHVFQAQLQGRELAAWRADDGYVNVWENRCLHRGVRLSIGINDGRELKCQYHGWRYANRTAGCTYIPAHPADAPARTICNRTYPAVERYGLVWSALEPHGAVPELPGLDGDDLLTLRGIPVNAPADLVLELLRGYRFQPNGALDGDAATVTVEAEGPCRLTLRSADGGRATVLVLYAQPVDAGRTVIRGVLDGGRGAPDRLAILRHHNERLSALRDRAEAAAATLPPPAPLETRFAPVSPELAELPPLEASGRRAALRVTVGRKWAAAEGIAGLELRPLQGLLPTFQPGAHIDLHLPNGLIRQYSLVNGPGETDRYVVGVKLESPSSGGSACVHGTLREGDVVAISEPRNNFPLRRDATETLLVAGGIGITPLLAMAQTLHHQALPFRLHYFAQGEAQLAFADRLATLGAALVRHLGLDPPATGARLTEILGAYAPGRQVYICGPGPMLEAARRMAAGLGWPDSAVHFEYFKNVNAIDTSSSFEVALARSALTLQVPAGRSILEVLRQNGVDLPSSCEQGACGTCAATVIEGEPDHQDVYLNPTERRSGQRIMTCVSRAKSPRLVLDL